MKSLSIIFLALFVVSPAIAQQGWSEVGPFGTYGVLGHSGSTMFFGADGALYASTDDGESWKPRKLISSYDRVNAIAFKGDSGLFATAELDYFLTTDGGATWTENYDYAWGEPRELTFYQGGQLVITENGLSRSTNGGKNWTMILGPMLGISLQLKGVTMAVKGDTILVGTNIFGVYYSHDNGKTWKTHIVNGTAGNSSILDLFIVRDTVYALCNGRPVRSPDFGVTWSPLTPTQYQLQTMAGWGDTLYVGGQGGRLYRSLDRGLSWSPIDSGIIKERSVMGFFRHNGKDYVNTSYGTSTLEADNVWRSRNTGIATSFAIPKLGYAFDRLYLATNNFGVSYSKDQGATFKLGNAPTEGPPYYAPGKIHSFAIVDSVMMFSSSVGYGVAELPDVTRREISSTESGIYNLRAFDGKFYGGSNSHVHYSRDGKFLRQLERLPFESNPVNDVLVTTDYIFGVTTRGVYRSADSGKTWLKLTGGIRDTAGYAFATHGSYLYLGTRRGIERSSDDGETWEATDGVSDTIFTLHLAGEVMLAGSDHGIYRSLDQGKTWRLSSVGMEEEPIASITTGGGFAFTSTKTRYVLEPEPRVGATIYRIPLEQLKVEQGSDLTECNPFMLARSRVSRSDYLEVIGAVNTIQRIDLVDMLGVVHASTAGRRVSLEGLDAGFYLVRIVTRDRVWGLKAIVE